MLWLKPGLEPRGGHSAILHADGHVIHAAGDARAVVLESLADAAARYENGAFNAPIFRRV